MALKSVWPVRARRSVLTTTSSLPTRARRATAASSKSLGSWNPLLPKDGERVKVDADRVKHWLSHGAQPTDRVLRFLDRGRHCQARRPLQPEEGRARQEGAGTRWLPSEKAQDDAAAALAPRAAPSRLSSRRPDDGNSRRLLRLPVEKLLDQAGGLLWILPEHVVAGAGKHLELGLRVGLFQPFLVGEIEQAVLLAP